MVPGVLWFWWGVCVVQEGAAGVGEYFTAMWWCLSRFWVTRYDIRFLLTKTNIYIQNEYSWLSCTQKAGWHEHVCTTFNTGRERLFSQSDGICSDNSFVVVGISAEYPRFRRFVCSGCVTDGQCNRREIACCTLLNHSTTHTPHQSHRTPVGPPPPAYT